jgi:spermidine/putrescine transport system substrate-binding protein
LKKRLAALLAALVLALSLFSGCAGTKEEVNVYNWGEYIDESLFKEFEKQTGIKVNYSTFTSNEAMYSVIKTGGAQYDLIIPSDYMISRLISEGMLEKLDFTNIPNYSLIDDKYKNLEYDPSGEYSVAYMTGTVGLIYNKAMIPDEIDSWGALFNERYAGQILMFDNSRDAFGVALKFLGYSLNTTDPAELNEAYELIKSQSSIRQGFVMDQIFDKLESGEAAIGPYYAGDYLIMLENNPDLAFAFPKEGTNRFVDAMCIPKGAQNKKNAELFIDFMCSTEASLRNMDVVGYVSANKEAADQYAATLDEEARAIMFPGDDILANTEVFINLPQETLSLYDELWIKIKS